MEKKMEFFTAKPNLHQVFGRTVTKELEFDEWTEDKMVHQTLKDLVLNAPIKNGTAIIYKPIFNMPPHALNMNPIILQNR